VQSRVIFLGWLEGKLGRYDNLHVDISKFEKELKNIIERM